MKIGHKIKKLRQENNVSTQKLAHKLHVSHSKVLLWESDGASPDYEQLKKLCGVFDVSISYFSKRGNMNNTIVVDKLTAKDKFLLCYDNLTPEQKKRINELINQTYNDDC